MIHDKIEYTTIDDLYLDPLNPRLGRENTGEGVAQSRVMELMQDWTLEELGTSFLESGYWPHEALLVVKEQLYGKTRLVVVEGNRRLAALKMLKNAVAGDSKETKWKELVKTAKPKANLFKSVPFLLADTREDVDSFLGFRHVTGIKEWHPAEKAEFIAKLIDKSHLTYEDVKRKIGSKTPTVRQNYIAYRLLKQMEDYGENIEIEEVEKKFSVLYLSLRTSGVQKYLHIDIKAPPNAAKRPVPIKHKKALINFARWLFGATDSAPLFTDSRNVDKFGEILESEKAVEYLERSPKPNFDFALSLAGGDEPEIIRLIETASDSIEQALARVHLFKGSKDIERVIKRLRLDAEELFSKF